MTAANAAEETRSLLDALASMTIIDLSHPLEPGMPVYPTHPQFASMPWRTGDISSMNQLLVSEHAGTHLDSPAHFYPNPSDPRHLAVADVPLLHLIGPAVKLDLRGTPPNSELGAADIRRWEQEHRPLAKDEAVVFQFGWSAKWRPLPEGLEYLEAWPGIDREAAEYLASRGVRGACTDCLGIDGSGTRDLGAHLALLEHGIFIVENLCALEKVPQEFLLVTLPLKITGGTGSPIRAVALLPDRRAAS
jgi:arylformamidase